MCVHLIFLAQPQEGLVKAEATAMESQEEIATFACFTRTIAGVRVCMRVYVCARMCVCAPVCVCVCV